MTEAMLIVVHPSPLLNWDKMSALNATECNWHLRCNVKGEKAWKAQSLDPPTLGGPELAGELFSKEQKGSATLAMPLSPRKDKDSDSYLMCLGTQSWQVAMHCTDIEAQVPACEVLSSSIGSPSPTAL